MRSLITSLLAFVLSSTLAGGAEKTEKEILKTGDAIFNRASKGELGAIDGLKDAAQIPSTYAYPYLYKLILVNRYSDEPKYQAVAKRAAKVLSELPDFEPHMRDLFKQKPDEPRWMMKVREDGIGCLEFMRTKLAIRILCDSLDEPTVPSRIAHYLSTMDIPGAPFSSKNWDKSVTEEGIQKWKDWWKANKEKYQD